MIIDYQYSILLGLSFIFIPWTGNYFQICDILFFYIGHGLRKYLKI